MVLAHFSSSHRCKRQSIKVSWPHYYSHYYWEEYYLLLRLNNTSSFARLLAIKLGIVGAARLVLLIVNVSELQFAPRNFHSKSFSSVTLCDRLQLRSKEIVNEIYPIDWRLNVDHLRIRAEPVHRYPSHFDGKVRYASTYPSRASQDGIGALGGVMAGALHSCEGAGKARTGLEIVGLPQWAT